MNLHKPFHVHRERVDECVNVLGGVVMAEAYAQSTLGLILGRAKGEERSAELFGVC